MSRSVLIPLVNGDELVVAHRHTGGLLLALRSGKLGNFRIQPLGVIAAEDVGQLRDFLAPGAAPTPARSDSHIITLTEVAHWHPTTPAEVARHNPGDTSLSASPWADRPDRWTERIEAAHPEVTGDNHLYATALEMVGHRHSKFALVNLVNWLLTRAEKAEAKLPAATRGSIATDLLIYVMAAAAIWAMAYTAYGWLYL